MKSLCLSRRFPLPKIKVNMSRMPVEHVVKGLCALSNGDAIFTCMNDDRGECVQETPAANDIRDSHFAHRNEAQGEVGEIFS